MVREPYFVFRDVRARKLRNARVLGSALPTFMFGFSLQTLVIFASLSALGRFSVAKISAQAPFGIQSTNSWTSTSALPRMYRLLPPSNSYHWTILKQMLKLQPADILNFVVQSASSIAKTILSAIYLARAPTRAQHTTATCELQELVYKISSGVEVRDQNERVVLDWMLEQPSSLWKIKLVDSISRGLSSLGNSIGSRIPQTFKQILGALKNFVTARVRGIAATAREVAWTFPQSGEVQTAGCTRVELQRHTLDSAIVVTVVDTQLCDAKTQRFVFRSSPDAALRSGLLQSMVDVKFANYKKSIEALKDKLDSGEMDESVLNTVFNLPLPFAKRNASSPERWKAQKAQSSGLVAYIVGLGKAGTTQIKTGLDKLHASTTADNQVVKDLIDEAGNANDYLPWPMGRVD